MEVKPPTIGLPYQRIWDTSRGDSFEERLEDLKGELIYHWADLYEKDCGSEMSYDLVKVGNFSYLNDSRDYGDEDFDIATMVDFRVVCVCGVSVHVSESRDSYGMRAPDNCREFGATKDACPYDRGHFIAHSLGGFDQIGLFPQRRDVNQGRGEFGKRYVAMEEYARKHPGTFIFSRPLYGDNTPHPFWIEYGVLKEGKEFWVEIFPNRYEFRPFTGKDLLPQWFLDELERDSRAQEIGRRRHQRKLERRRQFEIEQT